jgi:hypothetical protein
MTTAMYFGAGLDIRPIFRFPDITTFYFFDSQPYSEYGLEQYISEETGINEFYRVNFISKLDTFMSNVHMELINIDDNIRTYSNTDQIVHYYTNCSIPDHYDVIKNVILLCDTLILAGYIPNAIIMSEVIKPITILGYCENCYSYDELEHDSLTYYLTNNKDNMLDKFESFNYVSNRKTIKCNTWNEFREYSLSELK